MTIVYQRSNSRIPDFAVQMVEGAGDGQWEALVYYDDETWTFATKQGGSKDDDGFDVGKYELDMDADDEGVPVPIENEVTDAKGGPSSPSSTSAPTRSPTGAGERSHVRAAGRHHEDQRDADGRDGLLRLPAAVPAPRRAGRGRRLDRQRLGRRRVAELARHHRPEPAGRILPLDADPGGMWELPGGGSVGQFNPADPKGFLDPLAFQIRAGATLSRTPLYEFDLDGSGEQPSGEARRRADGPITKHAGKVKGQFGTVWSAIGTYALAALGRDAGKPVEAVWAPSETATDTEGIALVGAKIKAGIPPRQALLEAGYTQPQVDDFLPVDEDNGMLMPLSPDLIVQLATALQSLGQAKNLGSVTDDQIRRIFQRFFGDIAGDEPLPAPVAPTGG
jgi:hypothetical protein